MIAIHQPNYLPWLGFLDKARIVNTFVLLDNVIYTRGSVINRNKIKTKNGGQWLTVPVHHRSDTIIKDVLTVDSGWEQDHWRALLFNYARAAHFNDFAPIFQEIYSKKWSKLTEVNEALINALFKCFNLTPKILKSSDLDVQGKASELLVNICKAVGYQEYLSGVGAKEYLDVSLFEREGINVRFQQFVTPEYPQLFGEFIPNLSSIDYLFNCGNTKWWHQS